VGSEGVVGGGAGAGSDAGGGIVVELGVVLGLVELSVEPLLAQPPRTAINERTAGIAIARIITPQLWGEATACMRARNIPLSAIHSATTS
jgi:hypothetical protein